MDFTGKTVLVTGAASGIGLACVHAFAAAGAKVILTDLNEEAGEKAAREFAGARFMPLDVTSRASAEALAARVEAEDGKLDVLINGAGWDIIEPFIDNPPEYWDRIVAINAVIALTAVIAFTVRGSEPRCRPRLPRQSSSRPILPATWPTAGPVGGRLRPDTNKGNDRAMFQPRRSATVP